MSNRAIVRAEGTLLDQILAATYDIWHEGLSRSAYARYYAAQKATAWGATHLERLALVEADEVLASSKVYRFDATLDARPVRVVGLGAVFTQSAHRGRGAAREVRFFIAEEGASAVAYVVITVRGRKWSIEECGDRDPTGARVGAILQVLLARDPAERRPDISAWLPSGFLPPQLTVVDRRPSKEVMTCRPLSAKAAAATTLEESDVLYWKSDMF